MSDTQDQDQTMFVRAPGANPETAGPQDGPAISPDQTSRIEPAAMGQKPAERAPSLDSVDFDVTAGFGDEPPPASDEFFDITEGAESPMPAEGVSPALAEPASPAPTAGVAPAPAVAPAAPSTAPEAVPAASGGGGNFVVIAIIIVAVAAVALWLAMR